MKIQHLVALILFLMATRPAFSQTAARSDDVRRDILFMLEEEKMARDVYDHLKTRWTLPVFDNISRAEQHHLNLMTDLAKQWDLELPAPVTADEAGVFANADLQQLYNTLSAEGEQSLIAALSAGARVEETDIHDLQQALTRTDDPGIRSVYERLERASGNHLRAFTRLLKARDVEYVPAVLPQEEFDRILNEKGQPAAEGASAAQQTGPEAGCCRGAGGQGCGRASRISNKE